MFDFVIKSRGINQTETKPHREKLSSKLNLYAYLFSFTHPHFWVYFVYVVCVCGTFWVTLKSRMSIFLVLAMSQ